MRFALDHLKTKNMCKHAIEKLPSRIRYVPDKYKIQEMLPKLNIKICS